MYELVELRNDEVFTNSKVIAEGTGNKHSAVQAIISKYSNDIEEFELSNKVYDVLIKATSYEKNGRYKSIKEFHKEFINALED